MSNIRPDMKGWATLLQDTVFSLLFRPNGGKLTVGFVVVSYRSVVLWPSPR